MKGDVLVIEEHHRSAAREVARSIVDRIRGAGRRFAITIAGESGSGKSETASALAEELARSGIASVVLGQDDYFVVPPKSNDARRRQDPAWLGPHCEVDLDRLQTNVDSARAGADAIEKPLVDYGANSIGTEIVPLAGARVVIVEGTYVSLLRHVDCRVFIARNRLDTLEHRKKRNRGDEALDPFIENVLGIEHKIIAGHRALADFVITSDYQVVQAE